MSESLIVAENLSKKFCKDLKKSLWYGLKDLGFGVLGGHDHAQLRKSEFWAVRDLNFEVKRGECLGLIGHNGAGKSTLLKMLNGLILPDTGQIKISGRVSALIELGAGFNPILTGRENIYNNAAVLGFSTKETTAKMDEIIEFAEIGDFIDSPVQFYSSGMKVRLGFAVAAQLKPDVLLIDEVLAVGDLGFVLKCFNKMDQLLNDTAMILVSHSMPHVSRMCTKVLLMDHGKMEYYSDDVSGGLTRYYENYKEQIGNFKGSDIAELKNIRLSSAGKSAEKGEQITVEHGTDMEITVEIYAKNEIVSPLLGVSFYDKEQRVFAEISNCLKFTQNKKYKGHIQFTAVIPRIQFAQGRYSITLGFSHRTNGVEEVLFRYQSAVYFTAHSQYHGWSPIQLDPEWKICESN
jgi:lipopolysaccharide transport system ATP-binding protein